MNRVTLRYNMWVTAQDPRYFLDWLLEFGFAPITCFVEVCS